MSKTIQIRNVPDSVHRRLKSRAAVAEKTLSDYLLAEIECVAALPTRVEVLERIHVARGSLSPFRPPTLSGANTIRSDRRLVTCDARLGGAPGQEAQIDVVRCGSRRR